MAQRVGGYQCAFHVVIHGKLDFGIAGNLAQCGEWSNLALRQANRAFAVDADRVNLASGRSDQNHGVQIGGLQRQRAALILQEHSGFFAGLLNDLCIGLDGLFSDVCLDCPSR